MLTEGRGSPELAILKTRAQDQRHSVEDRLLELWLSTGFADPILKYHLSELADHADEVCSEYRTWLEKNPKKDEESLVLAMLTKDIEATKGEYCWVAMTAIDKKVYFQGFPEVTDLISPYLPLTAESRKSIATALAEWFAERSRQHDLWWEPQSAQFTTRDGLPFRFPDVHFVIKSDQL